MPQFDSTTRAKIGLLRTLRAGGTAIDIYEMVKISWPSPTGAINYAALPLDELPVPPPVSPIECRLKPERWPAHFVPVTIDSSIGDEELDLTFWDQEGDFADLLEEHGEGAKVDLLYWFPQAELLLPIWLGHLRVEDEADVEVVRVKAVNGFRSTDATMPRRGHWQECQAIFGGLLDSLEAILENDCIYSLHLDPGGVGNINPLTGLPYTSCPRKTRAQCIARLGFNGNYMLSHQTVPATVANNQTSGNRLFSTSRGNETNLEEPVRVIMGRRRVYDCKVLVDRRDLNKNDPEKGFYVAVYEVCEGPVQGFSSAYFNAGGAFQWANLGRYAQRLGEKGQPTIDPTMTVHSYSGTALIRYYFGWIDPSTVSTGDASASVVVQGLRNIRVYSTPEAYVEQYTANRAWHIARMLCDKRWGFGLDYSRLDVQSFIDAAEWLDKEVRFTDPDGSVWDHIRDVSNVELIERKSQEQIEDMCRAARLSRPYLFDGKIHISPLKKLSTEELAAAPVFYEEGDNRNILREKSGKSTLKRSRKSDATLVNRVQCTFDDAQYDYTKRPAPQAEDVGYQLKAGRIVGDLTKKVNPKKWHLLGVTNRAQAVKASWALLDLGEFDEGGLANNLRIKFKIWCIDALELHPTKVIKVVSPQLTRYGFDYFRVVEMEREGDLSVTVTAQAYNPDYMESFEVEFPELPEPPDPGDYPTDTPPPLPDPEPCRLVFGDVRYYDANLIVPIDPC